MIITLETTTRAFGTRRVAEVEHILQKLAGRIHEHGLPNAERGECYDLHDTNSEKVGKCSRIDELSARPANSHAALIKLLTKAATVLEKVGNATNAETAKECSKELFARLEEIKETTT